MTGLATYWRTLRHLRPQQVIGRVGFRLLRPRPDLRPAPAQRAAAGPWAMPARRSASLHVPTTFDFLNERHDVDEVGWDSPPIARLWRYNQHYFDDLNAWNADQRSPTHATLLERWIDENPPAAGTGWEPYPVSLRIVNWIKWSRGGHALSDRATQSLAVQTRWLSKRLETHLLGNHLFANAKSLVFAGLHFQGTEAAAWLRTGTRILERQLQEQVLPDGGQFERSPMYHALALEDVLDLINVIDASGCESAATQDLRSALAARVPAMLRWLLALSHPDGTLGHFNDSAEGVAPGNDELVRLAATLGFTSESVSDTDILHLPDSGYVRVSLPPIVALLDLAPVGPDYLPGHGHADTLSFELSLRGQRVIVNGGTSCYGEGPQRQRERSTAAHSTVEVDGQSSSEVWAGFRVGRRARPGVPRIERGNEACEVSCSHDGYAHLAGRPVHTRRWRFENGSLCVDDVVSNPRLPSLARYHLAPGIALSAAGPGRWTLDAGSKSIGHVEVVRGQARVDVSSHASRFGVLCPAQCLTVALDQGSAGTRWAWSP